MTLTPTMARRLMVVLSAVALSAVIAAPGALGGGRVPQVRGLERVLELDDPDRIPGSFIVRTAPGLGMTATARAISSEHGVRVVDTYGSVLRGFSFEGPDAAAARVAADPRILLVEADRKVRTADLVQGKTTAGIRRTYSNRPGGSVDSAREVDCTPGVKCTGTGIVGAIIDTGVALDHREFNGSGCPSSGCPNPSKFVDVDPADADTDTAYCAKGGLKIGPRVANNGGHGTRTSGNFAAEGDASGSIEGVANKAKIFAIRSKLSLSKVICSMNFLATFNKTYPTKAVRLANMSLSWGDSGASSEPCNSNSGHQAVCDLVAGADGILGTLDDVFLTVAAGNSNTDAKNTAPAGYRQTFTVSAMCDRNPQGDPGSQDGLANFSNFGPVIDAIGPGCNVYSPESGVTGYTTSSGTSRSAPHALGVAALLLQDNPALSAAQLGSAIRRTGQCRNLENAGVDETCVGQTTNWPRVRYTDYAVVGTDPDGIQEPALDALEAVCEGDAPPAC